MTMTTVVRATDSSRIEISLDYIAGENPPIHITQVRKIYGMAKENNVNGKYALDLLDKEGKVLKDVSFDVPTLLADPPPLRGETTESKIVVINKTAVTIAINFESGYASVGLRESGQNKYLEIKPIDGLTFSNKMTNGYADIMINGTYSQGGDGF